MFKALSSSISGQAQYLEQQVRNLWNLLPDWDLSLLLLACALLLVAGLRYLLQYYYGVDLFSYMRFRTGDPAGPAELE
jgi:hypothetical protein